MDDRRRLVLHGAGAVESRVVAAVVDQDRRNRRFEVELLILGGRKSCGAEGEVVVVAGAEAEVPRQRLDIRVHAFLKRGSNPGEAGRVEGTGSSAADDDGLKAVATQRRNAEAHYAAHRVTPVVGAVNVEVVQDGGNVVDLVLHGVEIGRASC